MPPLAHDLAPILARGEEALAAALRADAFGHPAELAQSAFRRLCLDRARKRAARDRRLTARA